MNKSRSYTKKGPGRFHDGMRSARAKRQKRPVGKVARCFARAQAVA